MKALSTFLRREVEVVGAGRTDAGVHAIGQVANFHLDEHFSAEEIFEDLNRHLPEDIAVTKIKEVDERFHSRYQAVEKTYRYRIRTSPVPNVFERKFLYQYGHPLDVDKMKKLSTIRNQKMPKNRVIHEVMNIIHIIWDKLFVDDRDKNKRLFC